MRSPSGVTTPASLASVRRHGFMPIINARRSQAPSSERIRHMSQLLRRAVERIPAPIPVWIAGTYQFARYPQVRQRRLTHRRILGRLHRSQLVSQGSFQGMNYIPRAYYSEILPKLVGTYERELIPAIEMICRADCDWIVDIGAAEGFYAVGMA